MGITLSKMNYGQNNSILYWRFSMSYSGGYNNPLNYLVNGSWVHQPTVSGTIGINSGKTSYSNFSLQIGTDYEHLVSSITWSLISFNLLKSERRGAFSITQKNTVSIEPFIGFSFVGNPIERNISNYSGLSIHINFLTSKIKKS